MGRTRRVKGVHQRMRRNRYFLMRHGESLANLADRIVSLPENGVENFGLSDLGREQAESSARASGLHPDLVVCSDFLRTRQTAEIAAEAMGTTNLSVHPGLRERGFGQLEGQSGDDYLKVWAEDERDPEHTLFGVESATALAMRSVAVLDELESLHAGKVIVLVSHGDTLRLLQLDAAGRPLTEHLNVRLFAPAEIRELAELPPR